MESGPLGLSHQSARGGVLVLHRPDELFSEWVVAGAGGCELGTGDLGIGDLDECSGLCLPWAEAFYAACDVY